ncbi:MAG: phosphoribosylamine--glycine ligase [Planctomycetota bacterium]|nr:phosphoribosylamine--glycine ligase [Planctomycetota bacterium]
MPSVPDRINVLLIGTGGREHALAWKMRQSARLGDLWVQKEANAALQELGQICPETISITKSFFLLRWCDKNDIGLVVIGPEGPLAEGLADLLVGPNRMVFGPRKDLAQIESDKGWAKQIMREALVPTAEGRVFTSEAAASKFVVERDEPCVVKAAGLCAGKGVTVCATTPEAQAAISLLFKGAEFGAAGSKIVIEEMLEGQEASVLALVDGSTITVFDPCQDHKRVGEGDTGPNTGGMGAYCPAPIIDEERLLEITKSILVPTVDALRRQHRDDSAQLPFRGVLFAGIMMTHAGPKVIEFNARFGDPETQAIMMRFKGDLVEILYRTAAGTLDGGSFTMDPRVSCCVVVCANGYPGKPAIGHAISGIAEAESLAGPDEEVVVFHGGTTRNNLGELVTSGGRVVGVTALAENLARANELASAAAALIRFQGAFFRRDIGHKALKSSAVRG